MFNGHKKQKRIGKNASGSEAGLGLVDTRERTGTAKNGAEAIIIVLCNKIGRLSVARQQWKGALLSLLLFCLVAPVSGRANEVIDRQGTRFSDYPEGAIVIDTSERKLYYMLKDGKALLYRVAVGKPHMQWFGRTFVTMKRKNPGWRPTPRMRRMGYPAYVPPGPKNPLGVRAIYLGWSEYRIHGTTSPGSIGRAASSGCIRMLNKDVVDLFERVHIGAPVDVIR